MILDSFRGNVLKRALFDRYGLPVFVVVSANGKRKSFSGETAYQDAQRHFDDLNLS